NRKAGIDYFILNARRQLFASARLRRAVNYALDRTALSATALTPAAPADHYLPPGLSGYRPAPIYPLRPDLATARRLAGARRGCAQRSAAVPLAGGVRSRRGPERRSARRVRERGQPGLLLGSHRLPGLQPALWDRPRRALHSRLGGWCRLELREARRVADR